MPLKNGTNERMERPVVGAAARSISTLSAAVTSDDDVEPTWVMIDAKMSCRASGDSNSVKRSLYQAAPNEATMGAGERRSSSASERMTGTYSFSAGLWPTMAAESSG